jgi:serine protease AprX
MARKRVMVEMRMPRALDRRAQVSFASRELRVPAFDVDPDYPPVAMAPPEQLARQLAASNEEIVVVRGSIDDAQEEALRRDPRVIAVWIDARIEPFRTGVALAAPDLQLVAGAAADPCPPCDCDASPGGAKGDLAAAARFIGADRVWAAGYRGAGIVIGVCDTGVHRSAVPALIDGWSPPGGTPWGDDGAHFHGTMCAVDALGACPEAWIIDLGILKSQAPGRPGDPTGGLLTDALAAYDWAIARYRTTGSPQVLTNSWGLYQESWGPDYARNPGHPFTRKALEAIDAGILVCFAAGNCGQVCPSGRCGGDVGPGRSIWGANGHPDVLTVGAVNTLGRWIGYTSQGPAGVLDARKPDVCAPSHFYGYTANDNGTSAACPVAAGVLGLLRQAKPALRQAEALEALRSTARELCGPGWDPHSGHGIIDAAAALERLTGDTGTGPGGLVGGVQWRGTVGAHCTVRWYTVDWPATWHVLWTVVPLTVGAGQAQIRWTVEVARTSGQACTYWIGVTNLTGSDVEVEGRYAYLEPAAPAGSG